MTPSQSAPTPGVAAESPTQDKKTNPPAKQSANGEKNPTSGHEPCCCRDITLKLERVGVTTLTDAGSIPGISKLAGLAADHVFVRATDCKGNVVKYPDDVHGIKLDAGETASPHLPLATITPDANCYVDCVVRILVHKGSKFNEILDAIANIATTLEKATSKLASDTQNLQTLLKATGPQGTAVATAIAGIAADQDLINSLNSQLAELLKALVGTEDTLMDDISMQFKGSLACEESLASVTKESGDWKQDPNDKNRATLDVSIKRLGGLWTMLFVAFKDCTK
jgi:hypothetical protein